MKLKTLLEYQRCYNMLRDAEGRPLLGSEHIDALKAKSVFDSELAEHLKPITVEITNETHR